MREPRVCAVVTGRTSAEIRQAMDAVSDADMVELRLDYVERPDIRLVLSRPRKPVIVTCRASWEGGRFSGGEDARRRLLESALECGAEYVDVERRARFAADLVRATGGRRLVISEHHFDKRPADVGGRIAALEATGGEIAKLAIRADRLEDMLPLFEVSRTPIAAGRGRVLIAMGDAGLPSRILAHRLGSRWTYVGAAIAPGQVSAARLLEDFQFRRIAPDAAFYGVVGNPIVHSRSPIMHNAGFAALGLDAVYVPFQAADADDFVRFARAVHLQGASITTPFKVSLLPYMDEIDPLAQRVGAINTLIVRDGRWVGANTDVEGFLEPLLARMDLRRTRATVLGSGGAARGVAVALAGRGAEVTISARNTAAATAIVALVDGRVGAYPPPPGSWDLLVNATTVGSRANPGNPMGNTSLDGTLVYDLVYAPQDTELLNGARAAGCGTIGGIEMLIAQAERQFQLWTGQRPPAGLFRRAAGVPAAEAAARP